ncbi:MAG: hypothetical protein DWQ47_09710 [Acidobacteria bacterium]|nr:MAG: hypothetical protein DWQ32_17810 [Acidobacteriota bacterium]REJ98828.1 MAG: hypothetical protein DWQ38_12165 [Acidobacteriota bacterium]REK16452.1 MAG: hypothetical protein DWQ43_05520 [Acidobacteriota bacterium]REK44133.1 MAG: hypothetical protein DWQ47_09710 [Acidobacteriota bacterium]
MVRRSFALAGAIFILVFSAAAQNSISGIVFDPQTRPVNDIDVELLDSFERLIGTRKTSGSGFYTFQRLNAGIYYLKVRVAGTNFRETKQRIDLGDLNAIGGVDQKQIDIFLEYDPRLRPGEKGVPGVVFAQEVPESAKAYFETASAFSEKNPERALEEVSKAVDIFPEYFLALELLGDLSLKTQKIEQAEAAFLRATNVNPRCFGCFFNLGIARNKLNKHQLAAESLEKANALDSGSINSHLLLGIVYRKLKRFSDAEAVLLRAKELGKDDEADVNWQLAELYYFDLKQPKKAIVELEGFLGNLTNQEKRDNRKRIETIRRLIRKIENEVDGGS